jgi:hypothetical protein
MQVLLYRGRPMDVWVKQPLQPWPVAALNRGQHVTDRGHLLRHG